MPSAPKQPHPLAPQIEAPLLKTSEIIEAMIDLQILADDLKRQIEILQPAFFAACAALGTEKIDVERAMITRRLTPGKWDYAPNILQQEALLNQLRLDFRTLHDPISGREVTWRIQLRLNQS